MLRFLLVRILQALPVIFVVITATFFLVRSAPGGPFDQEKVVIPEVRAALEAQYRLDLPLHEQYFAYLGDLAQGDLGPSFKYPGRSVNEILFAGLPVTAELGLYALIIALVIGVTAGVFASLKPNTAQDYIPMSLAMIGICLPTFVMGPLLMLVFSLKLGWFPATGWGGFSGEQFFASDMVLPSVTLGFFYAAYISRLTRGGMLDILTQDYIRTAKAKGASGLRVILKHSLRGGLLPVISFMGPAVAGLIAGSFVIETIFAIPGLGQDFVKSAFNRDYTLVLGVVMFYATLIILLNLIVDILQVTLNPKLKFD